jgi:hypothetical protein
MVAFCVDCIDHLDSFFWHLPELVPPPVYVILFLGASVIGSSGWYDIYGCVGECRMRSLNENFSVLPFMENIILACSA